MFVDEQQLASDTHQTVAIFGLHTKIIQISRDNYVVWNHYLWQVRGRTVWRGNLSVVWHWACKLWASFQTLVSTLSNWPHCRWKIKWPAWLLMLTVMDGALLYLIRPLACPFYFHHSVLSSRDVCAGERKPETHNGVSAHWLRARLGGLSDR